jgi:predicted RNA-binding protein with PUA-like domain
MKSEPDVFSLDDLKNCPKKTEPWDGIRNYQARNFMRDDMKKGDVVLFYHSNCKEPGIVGLAEIASKAAYPDPTQFDKKSKYFDPKSGPDNPRWLLVDVRYRKRLKKAVSLKDIKAHKVLKDMKVAQRGMRLSIQPVEEKHAQIVLELGG